MSNGSKVWLEYPVNMENVPEKNTGLDPSGGMWVDVEKRKCPCTICKHKSFDECEQSPLPCPCCSSVCT